MSFSDLTSPPVVGAVNIECDGRNAISIKVAAPWNTKNRLVVNGVPREGLPVADHKYRRGELNYSES